MTLSNAAPVITVVGSINQDLVLTATCLPQAGETIFGDSFATHPGGKGANQAVAAARLGVDTRMVGCVGADAFGTNLLRNLVEQGVRTGAVATTATSTGVALIQVEPHGENRITVVAGANGQLTPALLHAQRDHIVSATMVLTQLETPMATTLELARICHEHEVPMMLDPAPAAPLAAEILQATTWLTPNQTEAVALLGASQVEPTTAAEAMQLAQRLLEIGPQGVLLKLGSMGCVAGRRGQRALFQPAFRVDTVDTTGAGDTCNAAFAAALVRGKPDSEALRIAAAAGALATTKPGAQNAMPTEAEVDAFLQQQGWSQAAR